MNNSIDNNITVIGGLPMSQDMFYSYFLTRCSEFSIRKPNRWVLDMLENFWSSNGATTEETKTEGDNNDAPKIDEAKLIAADTAARTIHQSVLDQTFSPARNRNEANPGTINNNLQPSRQVTF